MTRYWVRVAWAERGRNNGFPNIARTAKHRPEAPSATRSYLTQVAWENPCEFMSCEFAQCRKN